MLVYLLGYQEKGTCEQTSLLCSNNLMGSVKLTNKICASLHIVNRLLHMTSVSKIKYFPFLAASIIKIMYVNVGPKIFIQGEMFHVIKI